MFSSVIEAVAFCAFVAGVYELAGRGWALIAAALLLLVIGVAVEGLNPIKLTLAVAHDARVKLALWRAARRAAKTA